MSWNYANEYELSLIAFDFNAPIEKKVNKCILARKIYKEVFEQKASISLFILNKQILCRINATRMPQQSLITEGDKLQN